jgi:hypothetical protein
MGANRVLIEVVVNLTDMRRGDRAWVPETDRVKGMVAGGYWKIVERQVTSARKVKDDGADPDQPQ